jgi:hypothetical protein
MTQLERCSSIRFLVIQPLGKRVIDANPVSLAAYNHCFMLSQLLGGPSIGNGAGCCESLMRAVVD